MILNTIVEKLKGQTESRDRPGFQLYSQICSAGIAAAFHSAVLVAAIVGSRLLFFFFQHIRQLVDTFEAGDGGSGLRQETSIRVDSLNGIVGSHGTCNFFNQLSDTHFKLQSISTCR
jgi:hypothetical protein